MFVRRVFLETFLGRGTLKCREADFAFETLCCSVLWYVIMISFIFAVSQLTGKV